MQKTNKSNNCATQTHQAGDTHSLVHTHTLGEGKCIKIKQTALVTGNKNGDGQPTMATTTTVARTATKRQEFPNKVHGEKCEVLELIRG